MCFLILSWEKMSDSEQPEITEKDAQQETVILDILEFKKQKTECKLAISTFINTVIMFIIERNSLIDSMFANYQLKSMNRMKFVWL